MGVCIKTFFAKKTLHRKNRLWRSSFFAQSNGQPSSCQFVGCVKESLLPTLNCIVLMWLYIYIHILTFHFYQTIKKKDVTNIAHWCENCLEFFLPYITRFSVRNARTRLRNSGSCFDDSKVLRKTEIWRIITSPSKLQKESGRTHSHKEPKIIRERS